MIRAVILDTWRQSRQQVVFIVMLVSMLLALAVGIIVPRPILTDDGEKRFGTVFSERPADFLADQWVEEYAQTLGVSNDPMRDAMRQAAAPDANATPEQRSRRVQEMFLEQRRLREEAVNKATDIPRYQRAAEYWVFSVVGFTFKATMLLFIAACAGYFPAMLGSGAVDIVLSKPLSRLRIYAARYVGGIALYAAALAAFCVLLFVGVGLRTGIFHWRIFLAIPLLVFSAMLLYALLALVGTVSRSATMAMVVGFVFYVVVDSAIELLFNAQPALQAMGLDSIAATAGVMRNVMPNFGLLNDMALASLLNMPKFQLTPFAVALAWLAGSLALGYWVFRRRDY